MKRITMQDVAVMSVQFVQYSFDYYLDSMEKCCLHKVDFWGGSPHYCRLDYRSSEEAAARLRELRGKIEAHGMETVMYTPETLGYPFSYSSPDRRLRERTIEYMKLAMEDALTLGTDKVFLNTGCHSRDLPREEGWKRTVESFQTLCDFAEHIGVELVLEQLQPYESNLATTLPDIQRMLNEVDSAALGVCVDLTAMEVAGERLEDYCETFGKRFRWVHYSDSHHLILGDGEFGKKRLEGYIRTLEKYDYAGAVDLEINDSIYWEDPHSSVFRSAEYLRAMIAEQ